MEPQLTHRTSSDLLKIILATLQSLEIRFEDQNMRLGTIETSIVSSACSETNGSPRSPCSHHLSRVSDGKHTEPALKALEATTDHPTAPAYMASVLELQKRFFFNVHSSSSQVDERYEKFQTHESIESADDDNDWYSQSVYSSRPLSRLELETPSTPAPSQRKAQRATSNIKPLSQVFPLNTTHSVFDMHHEGTAESSINHVPSTPLHSFSCTSQARTSFSDTQPSLSTRQTSISMEGAPSPTESRRSVSGDLRSAYNNIKQSLPQASQFIKRSLSIRTMSSKRNGKGKEEALKPDQIRSFGIAVDCMVPVTILEKPKWRLPFFQIVERTAKSCRTALPNMCSYLTRETYFIPI